MKLDLKYLLTLIGLGATLVAYAHSTFSTKNEVKTIKDMLSIIDQRVYDIHKYYYKE